MRRGEAEISVVLNCWVCFFLFEPAGESGGEHGLFNKSITVPNSVVKAGKHVLELLFDGRLRLVLVKPQREQAEPLSC